jgi:hypothetical protein
MHVSVQRSTTVSALWSQSTVSSSRFVPCLGLVDGSCVVRGVTALKCYVMDCAFMGCSLDAT